MDTHDKARRDFLLKTAAGMGAAATAALVPETPAQAQMQMPAHTQPAATHKTPAASRQHNEPPGEGAFFNANEAQAVAAFAERIMPGAPGKPGATDADVLNYIDLALAGAYADQQEFYRSGLKQLDAYCHATYKKAFVVLTPVQQDEVITALQQNKATGFDWPKADAFFTRLRTHTMEGMFADPVYGGNKNYAGWRLVGFPGAQEQFTAKDMASKERFTRMPMTGIRS